MNGKLNWWAPSILVVLTYVFALLMNQVYPKGPSGVGPDIFLFIAMYLLLAVQISFGLWHLLSQKITSLEPYRLKFLDWSMKLAVWPIVVVSWAIFILGTL